MVRHRRGLFERAAVLQIGGDPGCPEAVVAELCGDAGRRRAPSDHRIGARLRQHVAGELARAAPDRAEQWSLGIARAAKWFPGLGVVAEKSVTARQERRAVRISPPPLPSYLRSVFTVAAQSLRVRKLASTGVGLGGEHLWFPRCKTGGVSDEGLTQMGFQGEVSSARLRLARHRPGQPAAPGRRSARSRPSRSRIASLPERVSSR
jgi:hypothetical protein